MGYAASRSSAPNYSSLRADRGQSECPSVSRPTHTTPFAAFCMSTHAHTSHPGTDAIGPSPLVRNVDSVQRLRRCLAPAPCSAVCLRPRLSVRDVAANLSEKSSDLCLEYIMLRWW